MTIPLPLMGQQAKQATYLLGQASESQKNHCLELIAQGLKQNAALILAANQKDRQKGKENGLSDAMIDRLNLEGRMDSLIQDVRHIASLPDPIGEVIEENTLPNGLKVSKCRIPIGVLGVIYESRPNVTIDVASLCIKTGNCALLRGGSETLQTNQILMQVIQHALIGASLPATAMQLIQSPDREYVKELLHLHQFIDLIIPRGGAALHQFCRENSLIPVITGGIGICHLFVDQTADLKKARSVIFNAKTQRPTVCNALDTVLIHEAIAPAFLPALTSQLVDAGVEIRSDEKGWKILEELNLNRAKVRQANATDWDTEWLSLVLGVKIVDSLEEAIQHIRLHSSGHSDGILTENRSHAGRFIKEIDSAAVYVNASTRFTDGGQLGLGAEVAISTQKLHARGPMGLKELTTYKWIILGDYHTRLP
ncbi:gamma-glutamyl phosphate reductase [Candidatus Protochlamydia naegleriophila]|uniref:Gamma-glutamyl phosphate reductase n=1 Tax=Candidatus Protochlamydia naegleriophila TaxID=389348 RepID=A0A0U5JF28_9BACT|nr:glutamate-5-semialdehyde dehydrogenase [Candidatus Protochlamydia naegleriophila]CUI16358.1 gamma-glutamyl phosphate reductase [Candidatus Protochlamydia naegleriophila]